MHAYTPLTEQRLLWDQPQENPPLLTGLTDDAPGDTGETATTEEAATTARENTEDRARELTRKAQQIEEEFARLQRRVTSEGRGEGSRETTGQKPTEVKLQGLEVRPLPPVEGGSGGAAVAALVVSLLNLLGKLREIRARPEGRQETPKGGEDEPPSRAPGSPREGGEGGPTRTAIRDFVDPQKGREQRQRTTDVIGARNLERTDGKVLRAYVDGELRERERKDFAAATRPEQLYALANAFVMDRMQGTAEDQILSGVSWVDRPDGSREITIDLNPRFLDHHDAQAIKREMNCPYSFTQGGGVENAAERLYNRIRERDNVSVVELLQGREGVCRHYAECVTGVFRAMKDLKGEGTAFRNAFVRHTDTIAAWRLLTRAGNTAAVNTLNTLGHHAFTTLYVIGEEGNTKIHSFDAAGLDIVDRGAGEKLSVAEDQAVWRIFAYVEMEEAGVISRGERQARIREWIARPPPKPENMTDGDWERFDAVARALEQA